MSSLNIPLFSTPSYGLFFVAAFSLNRQFIKRQITPTLSTLHRHFYTSFLRAKPFYSSHQQSSYLMRGFFPPQQHLRRATPPSLCSSYIESIRHPVINKFYNLSLFSALIITSVFCWLIKCYIKLMRYAFYTSPMKWRKLFEELLGSCS